MYHTGFKLAARSTFISLAPTINFFAKKYFPSLFKLRVYVRQKCAGYWGYVVRWWVGLKTDEGKKIRQGCYSPRVRVLAVLASKVDK
jgi:hypothetical protein